MFSDQAVCENCGNTRDSDMKKPCPKCGSRRYLLIGYKYSHEARAYLIAAAIVAALLLIALIAGLAYLFVINSMLQV